MGHMLAVKGTTKAMEMDEKKAAKKENARAYAVVG